MEPDAIEDYVQYAEKILDNSPQMNEANTKARLIRDLLELLGWDFATDVQLEYSIPMASRTHQVDYALLLEDAPVAFVEAKGCDTSLSDANRDQLRTYMKTQDIDWGLLTNGRTNEVFQRRVENGQVKVERLGTARVKDLAQKSNLLSALSKQSIKSGEAKNIARKISELQCTRRRLRENKDEIAESIARTVAEKVGDSISQQAENEAKTLVDNLVAELDHGTGRKPPFPKSDDFWEEVEQKTGIIKQGDEVILRDDISGAKQFRNFVTFLFEEGYLEADDIPIEYGRKRYLLNQEPRNQEGGKMKRPFEVRDEIYLEVNFSIQNIKQNILNLGEKVS